MDKWLDVGMVGWMDGRMDKWLDGKIFTLAQ